MAVAECSRLTKTTINHHSGEWRRQGYTKSERSASECSIVDKGGGSKVKAQMAVLDIVKG